MKIKITSLAVLIIGLAAFLTPDSGFAEEKQKFAVKGMLVEGCKCSIPCACEMTGVEMGCEGVGAMSLTGGSYKGVKLAGVKIAYATKPGDWMRLYLDVPKPEQRAAAEAFARAVYHDWGKIEAVKDAQIDISGEGGKYTLFVDGGKIMKLETEPVLGGDKKTAITHTNIGNPLNPIQKQGRTLSGTFKDANREFTLKNSNSFFNDKMKNSGKI